MKQHDIPDDSKVDDKLTAYQHIASNGMARFASHASSKGATAKQRTSMERSNINAFSANLSTCRSGRKDKKTQRSRKK